MKTHNSIIIVPSDSPVHFIWQLAGYDIGFGDPASTSSHLIPKQMLAKFGDLDPSNDFQTRHLGAHDAVAMAVMNKKVGAGGLSLPILKNLTKRGVVDPNAVRLGSAPCPREGLCRGGKDRRGMASGCT